MITPPQSITLDVFLSSYPDDMTFAEIIRSYDNCEQIKIKEGYGEIDIQDLAQQMIDLACSITSLQEWTLAKYIEEKADEQSEKDE